jgi:sulfite reductase alpha subunit-like flavoprotein
VAQVQVAFTVVRYEGKYGPRDGVATTWLERLCEPVTAGKRAAAKAGIRVPIFLRRCVGQPGRLHPVKKRVTRRAVGWS